MHCLHCQTPNPEVAGQMCLACAIDARYASMFFAEWRFLAQRERVRVGDEQRTQRDAREWFAVTADEAHAPVLASAPGLYRRRIRLAGAGFRFLDEGERVMPTDLWASDRTPVADAANGSCINISGYYLRRFDAYAAHSELLSALHVESRRPADQLSRIPSPEPRRDVPIPAIQVQHACAEDL